MLPTFPPSPNPPPFNKPPSPQPQLPRPVPTEEEAFVDECPDDPDKDFDEKNEDYLDYVISKIKASRHYTAQIKEMLAGVITRTEKDEQDMWDSYQSHLRVSLEWRLQQTGSSRVDKPSGSVMQVEEPGRIQVADEEALQHWLQSHLWAFLTLTAALSTPTSTTTPTATTPAPGSAQTIEAQETALMAFYQVTHLLPTGCAFDQVRTVLRFE